MESVRHLTHLDSASLLHTGGVHRELLTKAGEIISSLSPGKRESVREIVFDSMRRGRVDERARRFLASVSGSTLLGDLLDAALKNSQDNVETQREIGV